MTTLASPTSVRAATPADVPSVARTLFQAFHEDPFVRWLVRDDARLLAGYELWAERLWMPHGGCLTTADGDAVATWLPPGASHAGPIEQLRVLPAMARTIGRELPRLLRGLGAMEKLHPHEPHWYLPAIGVVPSAQGRGLGSALLEHQLARCDRDALPAYLEATTERNRALYERHGFTVVAEERLPGGGPAYWRMWRDPR